MTSLVPPSGYPPKRNYNVNPLLWQPLSGDHVQTLHTGHGHRGDDYDITEETVMYITQGLSIVQGWRPRIIIYCQSGLWWP